MALVSVMSAKGAPGATTTAMLLANLWPAPTVLADADPLGGDVALRLPGEHGPLDTSRGLMSLLPSARRGLEPHTVLDHAQTALGGQPVLAGLPGPEQAVAVGPLWPELAHAFARVPGADVVADVGQVSSRSPQLPLVERSVAVVCVFRPTAWSALHTRHRLESLEEALRERRVTVGVVCVATSQQAADAAAAARSITTGLPWVSDLGTIARDDDAVVMYEGGTVYRPERSLLVRSGRSLAERLYAALDGSVTPVVPAPVADPGSRSSGRLGPRLGRRGRRTGGARRAEPAERALRQAAGRPS